jgi:hypothetical protein
MRGDGRLEGVDASTGVVMALDAEGRVSSSAGVDGRESTLSVCAIDGSGLLCTTRDCQLGRGCFVVFFCFSRKPLSSNSQSFPHGRSDRVFGLGDTYTHERGNNERAEPTSSDW